MEGYKGEKHADFFSIAVFSLIGKKKMVRFNEVPIAYFFSSFSLLTLLDWHLGQARSTKGPLGSKGILNSCPHLKHLKVASSAIISPILNAK
jgi:hypothetical protein